MEFEKKTAKNRRQFMVLFSDKKETNIWDEIWTLLKWSTN